MDSGGTSIYLGKNAPAVDEDPTAPRVRVGTATGAPAQSTGTAKIPRDDLPEDFPRTGHRMPDFPHSLVGLGPMCDAGYHVTFTADDVIVYKPDETPVLNGWREDGGARLWCINLLPDPDDVRPHSAPHQCASLEAFSAYDLPSVEALVRYFHAAAGFPVRATWLKAIKSGNYASWPGLTYENAAKYCPKAVETTKGHLVQTRQGVRSTKKKKRSRSSPVVEIPNPPSDLHPDIATGDVLPPTQSNELHIRVEPIEKLYTDDCGRFPIRSRRGNQYIMVAYHCDLNVILVCPFKTRKDKHRLEAYNAIMERLQERGHGVALQILDNEASKDYKLLITQKWGAKFQLVPPNMHRRNVAERAIRTFKAHFLAILAGVAPDFPKYLWDLLLPQTELTLNLLRQSTLHPSHSAWEHFNGYFDYDATPLGPLGYGVLIHHKPSVRRSWDFRANEGWNVGMSLEHYRCHKVVSNATRETSITDTVEFRHHYLTQPVLTPEDRLLHGMNTLSCALKDAPSVACDAQLQALANLREIFHHWAERDGAVDGQGFEPLPGRTQQSEFLQQVGHPTRDLRAPLRPAESEPLPKPSHPRHVAPKPSIPAAAPPRVAAPAPRVEVPLPRVDRARGGPPPRVANPAAPVASRTRSQAAPPAPPREVVPVAHRTRSRQATAALITPASAAARRYSAAFLTQVLPLASNLAQWGELAVPVLDEETGKLLEHRALRKHPLLKQTWNTSYANELGRLCQGIGKEDGGGDKQRVRGTDTFRLIHFEDIPEDRRDDICFTNVVCEVRPQKDDPNRTRITIAGGRICVPWDIGTPTASLELVKLIINSVLSRPGAKFAAFDIKNFYLSAPMERPEYVKIRLEDIPAEFFEEYNAGPYVHRNWIYFEIVRACYGLP